MNWNIAPECISIVMLIIIWVYSYKGSLLPTLKNKFFQGCFFITFCAMITNIISTVMIAHYQQIPLWMTWTMTTIYFIFTPLMGTVYFLYSAAVIYEEHKGIWRIIAISLIPAIVYMIVILLNPLTKMVFNISLADGYVKEDWIFITYVIFYVYCAASVVFVFLKRNWMEKQIYRILAAFPVIAVLVIIIQQIYPNIILSGSAATAALLIIYLHLQNKQITMDYLTNVPNRQELLNMIQLLIKKPVLQPFSIIVISLRDFRLINNTYGQQNGDSFLKTICQYICSLTHSENVYRFNGDEFAILIRDSDKGTIPNFITEIENRFSSPWQIKNYSCIIRTAIGIVSYPDSAKSLENLINAIEFAVSSAKSSRDKKVCYCDEAMLEKIQRKQQIIEILKERLEDNCFELYYQPIIVPSSQRFLFAESLMRIWNTPIDPVYPSEFIPIAEETGIIVEITYQLLDQVCHFINTLLKKELILMEFTSIFLLYNSARRI